MPCVVTVWAGATGFRLLGRGLLCERYASPAKSPLLTTLYSKIRFLPSIVRAQPNIPRGPVLNFSAGMLILIVVLTLMVGWLLLERHKRLRSEEARLRLAAIVESSEDAIIGVSLDGTILSWNDGARLMYGYTAAEVVGRPISTIVPSDSEEFSQYMQKLASAERIEHFETARLHKDGRRIDVSVGVSYIRDSRGRIIGAASIGRDISVRKHAENALRESEQELQRLAVGLINLQDVERRRLARELHDVTGQNVFAINLNLSRLQRLEAEEQEAKSLLAESRQLCDQALQEIRTLSYVLHPPVLDDSGLVSGLKWYIDGFVRRSEVQIDVSGIRDVGALPAEVEIALFRVVQESLTNISRHSGSRTAKVTLQRQDDQILLQIVDHGSGMPRRASLEADDAAPLGVGIPGMRQRLRQLGGTLQIESSDRGTVVTARVPANSVADDSHFAHGR